LRWPNAAALALAAFSVGAGCGGDDEAGTAAQEPRLVVFAAASMTKALGSCSARFPDAEVRLAFGGSDKLAAQIRQGVEPDVFAAAGVGLPRELNRSGLLERPVRFASNAVAVAVPRKSRTRSLDDLVRREGSLAIGSPSVPIGAYARRLIGRLPRGMGEALLANVRSEEPDVGGVVGKLIQGAVGAGVVYESDVQAADGALRSLRLPPGTPTRVTYAAGVGSGAGQPRPARAYVKGLVRGHCHRVLRAAGFGPPP
jgi:molybdate transport system substrate-binding protein